MKKNTPLQSLSEVADDLHSVGAISKSEKAHFNHAAGSMTAEQFKSAQKALSMTAPQFARAFRLGNERTVRRYATGDTKVNGPLSLAIEMALAIPAARRYVETGR